MANFKVHIIVEVGDVVDASIARDIALQSIFDKKDKELFVHTVREEDNDETQETVDASFYWDVSPERLKALYQLIPFAWMGEEFMGGFEDDESQYGLNEELQAYREAISNLTNETPLSDLEQLRTWVNLPQMREWDELTYEEAVECAKPSGKHPDNWVKDKKDEVTRHVMSSSKEKILEMWSEYIPHWLKDDEG